MHVNNLEISRLLIFFQTNNLSHIISNRINLRVTLNITRQAFLEKLALTKTVNLNKVLMRQEINATTNIYISYRESSNLFRQNVRLNPF